MASTTADSIFEAEGIGAVHEAVMVIIRLDGYVFTPPNMRYEFISPRTKVGYDRRPMSVVTGYEGDIVGARMRYWDW